MIAYLSRRVVSRVCAVSAVVDSGDWQRGSDEGRLSAGGTPAPQRYAKCFRPHPVYHAKAARDPLVLLLTRRRCRLALPPSEEKKCGDDYHCPKKTTLDPHASCGYGDYAECTDDICCEPDGEA